ncbi:TetR/AcrR family transcriptional regulator [Streptomyces sp. NPDC001848]|uniref:TetR/AcrR family transcriptional regulator n=1 Tax=Streptomyces sp. NPDC001848 TaxID=3364618 RepID=UPI0036A3C216
MTEPLAPLPPPPGGIASPTDLALMPTGETARLRADAARNRTRLLEVAARLAAERGIANVTMEDIASGAGVGKGTVFRRFGDRIGLMVELLSHHEEGLQAAFLSGPPPLGPGAPARERLHAFGSAVIRHEHVHRDLYLAAHTDASRRRANPAYQLRLAHVCMLLREARAEGDTELVAHTLLGYLETALVDHLLTRRGMSPERVEAGWCDLVDRYTGRCTGGCTD